MKRLFDLVSSIAALIIFAPVFVVIAIAVRMTSRGPVIYRARRAGQHGRAFDLLKFRSMYTSPPGQGAAITRSGDPRVTPLGRFLRAYKLDELPQFINVVRGEMSLVGPRPEDPRYVEMYDAEQREILKQVPGITSAASLLYRDEESHLTGDDWERHYVDTIMPDKLRIDLEYARTRTLFSDIVLILKTIAAAARVAHRDVDEQRRKDS